MQVLLVTLKSLGLSFAVCGIVLLVFFMGTIFWVRSAIRDKVYCLFLSSTKQLKGRLVKPNGYQMRVTLNGKTVDYATHPTKQFWSQWPPGFPKWVQEPVKTLLFVEGDAEPLDPYNRKTILSEHALYRISDEAVLGQVLKAMKDNTTPGAKPQMPSKAMIIITMVAVVAASAAAYLSFSSYQAVQRLIEIVGGV